MPDEYKLVQKIFNKLSLNNDLGDRPISISIRAGEYMHWKLKNFTRTRSKRRIIHTSFDTKVFESITKN